MADLRDFTGKNRVFTGAAGVRVSDDGLSSSDRVDDKGRIRFNDSTDLMEYYTGTEWKSIDSPPQITFFTLDGGSDVTSANIDSSASGNATIEIKGSLFDTTGATVSFVGTSETLSPVTTTRNSSNLLTVTVARSGFDNTNEPYTIKVTNGSGLSAELSGAINQDQAVTFINAADTNFDIFDSTRGSVSIGASDLCGATDPDSDTITYSVSSGSLPSGLTLTSATGAITGSTSAVGSDTVSTFTIQAATTDVTITRQFTITQKAPVVSSYTSSSNFVVPTGVSAVDVLVVAGGGAGGDGHSGGGGAGGLIYRPGFTVTPGATIPITVGNGSTSPDGGNGQDSVFSNLTAKGGGGGHSSSDGNPGGSGAGGSCYRPDGQQDGGSATQPNQSGDSGTYGFGNGGGNGSYDGDPPHGAQGGSGGGAGGSGAQSGKRANAPAGGVGKAYSISGSSVHYAGGGGNGCHQNVGQSGAGGTGGGGGSIPDGANANHPNAPGTANRGGGGGGGSDGQGGQGGSGVVILTY